MKILVISQRNILPATDGAVIYSLGLLKYLHKIGAKITLVSFAVDKDYSEEEIQELKKYVTNIRTCKLRWKSTALNISFRYPNNIRKYTKYDMWRLLKDIKKKEQFDLVIIDHLQMFEYAKLFPKSRIILHTHNVESDIWKEYASKCKGLVKMLVSRSAKMIYEYERVALQKADAVTAISDTDAIKFRLMSPDTKIQTLHGFNEYTVVKTKDSIYSISNNILFIGSYGWYPNVASAKFLAEQLLPRLRERGLNITLYLVGKEPTQEMKQYAQENRDIVVTGMVESVDTYIEKCDIFINAVVEGSGVNIKMIEAMGKGIPLITSEFGARGFDVVSGKQCYIYSNIDECVEQVVDLLQDRDKACKMRDSARCFYERYITPSDEIKSLFLGVNC